MLIGQLWSCKWNEILYQSTFNMIVYTFIFFLRIDQYKVQMKLLQHAAILPGTHDRSLRLNNIQNSCKRVKNTPSVAVDTIYQLNSTAGSVLL